MPDPTQAQYGTEIEKIPVGPPQKNVTPLRPPPEHGGGLPFTGFDVGAMLIVAVALAATGALLRRLAP